MRFIFVLGALAMLALFSRAQGELVVIEVGENCSLANAIRSANGDAQTGDGNECETGVDADDAADPPVLGADLIRLSADVTLGAALPAITSVVHIDGDGHTLSGDGKYRVIEAQGASLSIEALVIEAGLTTGAGGGLYAKNSRLFLRGIRVVNSVAGDSGGGIYASDSDLDIRGGEISDNSTLQSHGGGIHFVSSTGTHRLWLDGVSVFDNEAVEDGGGLKVAGGIVSISKSTFARNEADEGGAIESSEAQLTIDNSTFSANIAREGGGLSAFGSHVVLTHTTWAYNSAEEQGGGIAIIGWSGSFKIRNTLITDSESGGDCHAGPNADMIIEFTGNFVQDGSCDPDDIEATPAPTATGIATAAATAGASGADGGAPELMAQHVPDEGHDDHGDAMIDDLQGHPAHHPLLWGSPAIDGGAAGFCGGLGLSDDQIETERPQYDTCDVGAFEYPKPRATATSAPPPARKPRATPDGGGTPGPDVPMATATMTAGVCIVNPRISVKSGNADIDCAAVDILTLDKHPALAGARFAMRVWRGDTSCSHVVAGGDNLYRLARRYGTTAAVLRRHNDLPSAMLSVGQVLLLPSCRWADVSFAAGTEVCFDDAGGLAFVDTSRADRPVHRIEAYWSQGQMCGKVERPGVVLLLASDGE